MEKNYSDKYWNKNKIDIPNKQEIHKERCDNDPIYKIMFDDTDDEGFVEELLQICIKIVQKKYGKRFQEDITINYMFSLLKKHEDKLIKRIVLVFFLYWESNVYEMIKDKYNDKGGLFEDKGKDHFQMFYSKMGEFIEQTIRFPCNEQNIIEMMENFEKSAKMEYLMGPF
jgi:hypothetical protein